MTEQRHRPERLKSHVERGEWMKQMHEDGWTQIRCPEHDRYCLWEREADDE